MYEYFWHIWSSIDRLIFHFTQWLLLHFLGGIEPTKYKLKWAKIHQKHPQHYWHILKIIFSANIFNTTCHQMIALVFTSPNVCFCTTWENPNRRNKIKVQYFICFVSPGTAETVGGCGGKLDSHLMASCIRNIHIKKY